MIHPKSARQIDDERIAQQLSAAARRTTLFASRLDSLAAAQWRSIVASALASPEYDRYAVIVGEYFARIPEYRDPLERAQDAVADEAARAVIAAFGATYSTLGERDAARRVARNAVLGIYGIAISPRESHVLYAPFEAVVPFASLDPRPQPAYDARELKTIATVACPACGAAPGQDCQRTSSREASGVHTERRKAWQALRGPAPAENVPTYCPACGHGGGRHSEVGCSKCDCKRARSSILALRHADL